MSLGRTHIVALGFVLFALTGNTFGAQATGQAVTFSKDVAPIFYQNSAGCHRTGKIAPMSLLTYEEARRFEPLSA